LLNGPSRYRPIQQLLDALGRKPDRASQLAPYPRLRVSLAAFPSGDR